MRTQLYLIQGKRNFLMKESRKFNIRSKYFFSFLCKTPHKTDAEGIRLLGVTTTLNKLGPVLQAWSEIFSIQVCSCCNCYIISRYSFFLPSHFGVYMQELLLIFYSFLSSMPLPNPGKHYLWIQAQVSSKGTWLAFANQRKINHSHRFKGPIKLKVIEEYLLVRGKVMVRLRQNYFIQRP